MLRASTLVRLLGLLGLLFPTCIPASLNSTSRPFSVFLSFSSSQCLDPVFATSLCFFGGFFINRIM
ncbi:hypothetical protein F4808DRAFT_406949 [Astrocystis sublimbata]|nr:hypothetical protein F4808DRAFT_406949 [Astrocystis sublimbata]